MRTLVPSLALLPTLAALAIAGCGGPGAGGGYDPNAVVLCIQNDAAGYGNVVAYASSVRYTVYPGEEQCRDVRLAGSGIPIRATTTGGGAAGPLRFNFQLPPGTYCWHWRVTSSYAIDVVSCDPEPEY